MKINARKSAPMSSILMTIPNLVKVVSSPAYYAKIHLHASPVSMDTIF